jgi:[protein-PII] uridylyltransferase
VAATDEAKHSEETVRAGYERRLVDIRREFQHDGDGIKAAEARSELVDKLVLRLWASEVESAPELAKGVGIAAVGGYGRESLFPYSDVDLLFCVEKSARAKAKHAVRRVSQALWDCGMQASVTTRAPEDCERFEVTNPEFGLSLIDVRGIGGDAKVLAKLEEKCVAKLIAKDSKALGQELAALTRERHKKYGNTLFHLEPNIKDCPGGLRDAHVCHWLAILRGGRAADTGNELEEAMNFLTSTRCFLHYRHERDDNTLDWAAQDAAALERIGLQPGVGAKVDAAYWMRAYFRHARMVERSLLREMDAVGLKMEEGPAVKRVRPLSKSGMQWSGGQLELRQLSDGTDAARDPDAVLRAFALMAESGGRLTAESEEKIEEALPVLSANLEEGPRLWRRLAAVLTGPRAAGTLRTMHTLGVLELILPEFHGIDALVIRDAYHRYTVDEHTFVLIETLHGLADAPDKNAPEWRVRLGAMMRELLSPELLFLAALLHDTGKGRASDDHAAASAQMARGVIQRLEMDAYDAGLVLQLIEAHLEMSAALRRDIFDAETVRAFAAKVKTHESLRMLTLFTYADIAAVHPDAMTPWKAENLWRLSMATANQLDRHVDEERVHARRRIAQARGGSRGTEDKITRVMALMKGSHAEVEEFLEGLPERYVQTRTPETMREHIEMTRRFAEEPFQIAFQHGESVNEITLVTSDRPRLFAGMAGALAAWGMNVVTADAFANAAGVVVDSFRFTDSFKTLELNVSERERFVTSVRDLISGRTSVEKMLSGRRRAKRPAPGFVVETKIDFDDEASSSSTLLQVVAQDVPGLLRAISATLSQLGYNVEVALIDTEGETAIDVFYLTSDGQQLGDAQKKELRRALAEVIEANAA